MWEAGRTGVSNTRLLDVVLLAMSLDTTTQTLEPFPMSTTQQESGKVFLEKPMRRPYQRETERVIRDRQGENRSDG